MNKEDWKLWDEALKLLTKRIITGEQEYKERWKTTELYTDIQEELLDVVAYALFEYIKIEKIKQKVKLK